MKISDYKELTNPNKTQEEPSTTSTNDSNELQGIRNSNALVSLQHIIIKMIINSLQGTYDPDNSANVTCPNCKKDIDFPSISPSVNHGAFIRVFCSGCSDLYVLYRNGDFAQVGTFYAYPWPGVKDIFHLDKHIYCYCCGDLIPIPASINSTKCTKCNTIHNINLAGRIQAIEKS